MNHLNSAREHITSAFQATGENQMRSLRCAQVHAQIAQAESLQRIAECLETLVEAQTPDAGEAAIAPGSGHNVHVAALIRLIEELSEEATCAGWHTGCEYVVWSELETGATRHFIRDENDHEQLRKLSNAIGGWVAWDYDEGDAVYVPMDEWRKRYAEWREKTWQRPDATPDPLADLAPDWSQAPDWAQWWAVDDDGGCHWYADRPRPTDTQWLPPRLPSRYSTAGEIAWTMAAWRQCIWQRPQAQEATRPDWLPEWRGG